MKGLFSDPLTEKLYEEIDYLETMFGQNPDYCSSEEFKKRYSIVMAECLGIVGRRLLTITKVLLVVMGFLLGLLTSLVLIR